MQPSPTTEPGVGSLVGPYRLERELGRGGFGAVYAATSTVDGTRVALKVLSRSVLEQAGSERRFQREAELARRLRHPNVVRVLDAGSDAQGVPFIAFELLEGRSLENEIERWGAMPPARAVRIAIEVLAALEEAHSLGVIHRDLKPANVHLSSDGDRVKVLDFGIAKSTNPATLVGLTQAGMALGTPAYMAPEQVTGEIVGPGTDLFALGVVLIEMLMGRPLYDAGSSPLDILRERLAARPVPLPEVIRHLPIAGILERAVLPRSAERFASATEMKNALSAALPSLATSPVRVAAAPVPPTAATGYAYTEAPRALTGAVGPGFDTVARAPFAPAPTAASPPWPAYAPPTAPHPVGWNAVPAPAAPRSSGLGWILGGLGALACVVVLIAVLGGRAIGEAIGQLGGPRRPSTSGPAAPTAPIAGRPTANAPVAPPSGAESGLVRSCVGVANLQRPALTAAVTALGWAVTGEQLLCIGDMINFRCKGPEGKGLTLDKAGQEGSVVVIRGFASNEAVDTYVAKERTEGPSLGVGARAVARVEMPAADAGRLLDRLCK